MRILIRLVSEPHSRAIRLHVMICPENYVKELASGPTQKPWVWGAISALLRVLTVRASL